MTEEQRQKYLKNPFHCPYCNSENIESEEIDWEAMSAPIKCHDCNKNWFDCYTLTDVQPKEDEFTADSPVDAGERIPGGSEGKVQSDSQIQQGDDWARDGVNRGEWETTCNGGFTPGAERDP